MPLLKERSPTYNRWEAVSTLELWRPVHAGVNMGTQDTTPAATGRYWNAQFGGWWE